jgi:tetratricopeptide (TPR) repeat protein
MTRKIVSDNPKQRPKSAGEIQEMLARCRKKKCELPERTFGKKNSSFGRWKKYAAVAMAILVAAVGIQTMFSRMEISRVNAGSASGGTEKELEYGSASGVGQDADGHDDVGDEPIDDMSAEGDSKDGEGDSSSESGTFTEEVQSYAAQLNESLGLLYFQRLQEYETSLEYFEAADFPDENGQARINAYKTLARYYVESAAVEISDVEWAAEKLRAVLDEMPEETSAIQKLRFQLDLVRCYDRIQNTDKELQMIEECLSSQTEWESEDTDYSLRRELKEKGTTLYKAQSNWEKAIVLQKELLEHAEGTEDYENACLQLGELYFLNQQFAEGEALSLEGAGKCSNRAAAAANYAENVCGNPENDKAAKEEKITAIVAKVSEVTENEKFQKLQQEHRFSVENGKIIFE